MAEVPVNGPSACFSADETAVHILIDGRRNAGVVSSEQVQAQKTPPGAHRRNPLGGEPMSDSTLRAAASGALALALVAAPLADARITKIEITSTESPTFGGTA